MASDGAADDRFGISVALSADTALVGAPVDDIGANLGQGSVYVFVRSGAVWVEQAKLVASDGLANDNFGAAVALSGETALIGAYRDDIGANTDQGSAYVFVRSGVTWTEQAKLVASDGLASDNFGSVAVLSGETALLGAPFDDIGANTNQGSAYAFLRSGATWTQQAKLVASDGLAGDRLGNSVALSGDTALVGAPSDDIGANLGQGSAYVFSRSGVVWVEQAKLVASDGAADDEFGRSGALSGDTALLGAPYDDIGAISSHGSAYVFVRSGAVWVEQVKLQASDGAAVDEFGRSVALSDDLALVGAPFDDIGANTNEGSAYVFERVGSTWVQQAKLSANNGAADDQFSFSVALSGDTALVGVPFDDIGANADQGSAFVFVGLSEQLLADGFEL